MGINWATDADFVALIVTGRYWVDLVDAFGRANVNNEKHEVCYKGQWYACRMQADYCIGIK